MFPPTVLYGGVTCALTACSSACAADHVSPSSSIRSRGDSAMTSRAVRWDAIVRQCGRCGILAIGGLTGRARPTQRGSWYGTAKQGASLLLQYLGLNAAAVCAASMIESRMMPWFARLSHRPPHCWPPGADTGGGRGTTETRGDWPERWGQPGGGAAAFSICSLYTRHLSVLLYTDKDVRHVGKGGVGPPGSSSVSSSGATARAT